MAYILAEPATSCHSLVIAAIHQAAFGAASWSASAFAALLANPFAFGLIQDGGFILARAVDREAEILTLAVMPEQRRRGIAWSLLAASVAEAERRGAHEIFLEVAEDNRAAIALYFEAGFAQAGRRRDYYRIGKSALLLRRALKSSG